MKSVIAMIAEAQTVEQVRAVVNYANWSKPDGRMRRLFLRVAKKRIEQLERNRV